MCTSVYYSWPSTLCPQLFALPTNTGYYYCFYYYSSYYYDYDYDYDYFYQGLRVTLAPASTWHRSTGSPSTAASRRAT